MSSTLVLQTLKYISAGRRDGESKRAKTQSTKTTVQRRPLTRSLFAGTLTHTHHRLNAQMIVTAGTLEESREALELVKSHPNLYSTVGVHPTRCKEFFTASDGQGENSADPEAHVAALAALLEEGKALGKVNNGGVPKTYVLHGIFELLQVVFLAALHRSYFWRAQNRA